jgi:hypothetical protein
MMARLDMLGLYRSIFCCQTVASASRRVLFEEPALDRGLRYFEMAAALPRRLSGNPRHCGATCAQRGGMMTTSQGSRILPREPCVIAGFTHRISREECGRRPGVAVV